MQILIIVDVQGTFSDDEITAVMPHERDERIVLRLSAHGAAPIERRGSEPPVVDWTTIGRAIETACRLAREAVKGRTPHVYIAGQGPLPVFVHLGWVLSRFTGPQWVIARKPNSSTWELFPLADGTSGPSVFTESQLPTAPRTSSGQVAVYIDTAARPVNDQAIHDAVEGAGERVADIVSLLPPAAVMVEPETTTPLAAELTETFSRVPALFPRAASIGLFVAGPTVLAFAVGRAINPNVVTAAQLFNYAAPKYELVYSLPFAEQRRPLISDDPEAVSRRDALKKQLVAAIEVLKTEILEEDLAAPLEPEVRPKFLNQLRRLTYVDSDSDQFSLSVAAGTVSLGKGLLQALLDGRPSTQDRFVKLLLLHELFHDQQGVRSTNYFDVGRAGVVLESIDLTADLFALRVLTASAYRTTPAPAPDAVRAIAAEWLDAVLYGIQAFDIAENGVRITDLADRRLRRYLTWHLQRVRTDMVDVPEHVAILLEPLLTAELAPVIARVDNRFDRIVLNATPATEFFAAVGGRLVRHSKRPGFDPGGLIDAVRGYNSQAIQQAMRFVVEENKSIFVPWR